MVSPSAPRPLTGGQYAREDPALAVLDRFARPEVLLEDLHAALPRHGGGAVRPPEAKVPLLGRPRPDQHAVLIIRVHLRETGA
jgi:hypothetical protein